MIIKLHRWQEKAGRYRTQVIDGDYLSILCESRIKPESGDMVLRTQKVDRVMVAGNLKDWMDNGDAPTIELWLSPVVTRKYERKPTAQVKPEIRKPRASDEKCKCHHLREDHSTQLGTVVQDVPEHKAICLIPGCNCKLYTPYVPVTLPSGDNNALIDSDLPDFLR